MSLCCLFRFYISFLVSDKQVKLSVDEGSGMPEIGELPVPFPPFVTLIGVFRKITERIHNQKGDDEPENESDKVQCISKLDQVTWKVGPLSLFNLRFMR